MTLLARYVDVFFRGTVNPDSTALPAAQYLPRCSQTSQNAMLPAALLARTSASSSSVPIALCCWLMRRSLERSQLRGLEMPVFFLRNYLSVSGMLPGLPIASGQSAPWLHRECSGETIIPEFQWQNEAYIPALKSRICSLCGRYSPDSDQAPSSLLNVLVDGDEITLEFEP